MGLDDVHVVSQTTIRRNPLGHKSYMMWYDLSVCAENCLVSSREYIELYILRNVAELVINCLGYSFDLFREGVWPCKIC